MSKIKLEFRITHLVRESNQSRLDIKQTVTDKRRKPCISMNSPLMPPRLSTRGRTERSGVKVGSSIPRQSWGGSTISADEISTVLR
ncbi:hypothetical protein Mapa_002835 [Marchantia paleacea]|nr:hypothetical protein Mapa_002835 [Marchantia paleacea]